MVQPGSRVIFTSPVFPPKKNLHCSLLFPEIFRKEELGRTYFIHEKLRIFFRLQEIHQSHRHFAGNRAEAPDIYVVYFLLFPYSNLLPGNNQISLQTVHPGFTFSFPHFKLLLPPFCLVLTNSLFTYNISWLYFPFPLLLPVPLPLSSLPDPLPFFLSLEKTGLERWFSH